MQVEPANEFLSLVNCLETFLTRDIGDTASISNAFAVGVAWVLGQNFAERKSLRKEMKKLYDKRSSITHTGQQDDLADGLHLLRERVKSFLQAMVHRRDEFKTGGKKFLPLWIDEGSSRTVPRQYCFGVSVLLARAIRGAILFCKPTTSVSITSWRPFKMMSDHQHIRCTTLFS